MKRLLAAIRAKLELLAFFAGVVFGRPRARRKRAQRREPLPGVSEDQSGFVGRRKWRIPTPEEVDYARGCMQVDERQRFVAICRGPLKGCTRGSADPCVDCFKIAWHDKRPSAELLASMERGDA